MIPELGQLGLILALCVGLVQGAFHCWAHTMVGKSGPPWRVRLRKWLFWHWVCRLRPCAGVFTVNDFSVQYVASHSNSQLPTLYRFGAVWGGHEGSLLLWVFFVFGMDASRRAIFPHAGRCDGGTGDRRTGRRDLRLLLLVIYLEPLRRLSSSG